ncbi:two component response regulator [Slackia heliotrinireducens DSM 20476]|uniref:Two component response regulator n=1 Tax=Slackia heliotrinireducens (strain ATCC 29202 / DSM 20476 / NCTC 11029 / RHS 1) TaxID=471855 RepID=C7N5P9_SLAHD|nr:two component response regulator [Slackia heliotrinireducens DSM 20476]
MVDDERLMLRRFMRLAEGIDDLKVIGSFDDPFDALDFAEENDVDVAFLDIEMPEMDGIELARRLRAIRHDMLIVPVTAYESYIHESNRIGADYFIVKPYTEQVLKTAMEKLRLLAMKQDKDVRIQMFGRFLVKKNGQPVPLTGKAKEILALIVTRRGKEISNEEIYTTIWEGRPCDNASMSVYYNALKRLRVALDQAGLSGLLVSTRRGQTVDTSLFDCDFYDWKDKTADSRSKFEGEFLPEYTWSEYLIGEVMTF